MSDQATAAGHSVSVQFSNLKVTVGGEVRLQGLTHSLPAQGITALVGPNGAGKSLLLKALHGLQALDKGVIRWSEALREGRRALVRQQPQFLRRSVRDNLVFALRVQGWKARAAQTRAEETLDWLHLGEQADSPVARLSPGLQARLALARALALGPDVLLLDEPSASLDPEAALAMEGLIAFVRDQGTKVILVSHCLGQVRRLAQDVLMLNQGRSIFFGPSETFFADPKQAKVEAFLHAAGFWQAA